MSDEDLEGIFEALGPVTIRRMFGGKGIYFRGVIIAIEYDDELRLKADLVSEPEFKAAEATQWAYEGRRGTTMMPYWSVPHEAFDNTELMACWLRRAYEAGLRAQVAKAPGIRKERRLRVRPSS